MRSDDTESVSLFLDAVFQPAPNLNTLIQKPSKTPSRDAKKRCCRSLLFPFNHLQRSFFNGIRTHTIMLYKLLWRAGLTKLVMDTDTLNRDRTEASQGLTDGPAESSCNLMLLDRHDGTCSLRSTHNRICIKGLY